MNKFVFTGFEPANTTPVPDVLFDTLLPHLNEAQLKVLLYIVRRTLGFKKTVDAISLKQFRYGITTKKGEQLDSGCGLKNFTSIIKALKSLEEMGCIESEKSESASGDQATTVYRILFRGTARNGVPTTPNAVGVLRETEYGTARNGGPVLRETESQETVIQLDSLQESENVVTANADANAPTNFFVHPLHSFLSFDDLMKPTTMIIFLTSKQFESEMEDDRRYRIAGEIQHDLAAKGFPVKVQTTHDSNDVVVSSTATPAPSEKPQEVPVAQSGEKPKKRATRKPRAKKFEVPVDLQDRVNKVYECLDAWRQRITGDSEERFIRDAESDEAICSLFQGKPPTQKKLEQLCDKMWNEPANPRTGYCEREHMTIKRICTRYKSESLTMAVKEKPATTATSYSVGGYTYKPEEKPTEALPFVGPFRNRNKRRGA